MALWPTRPNENQRRPRESGDPWWVGTKMDSRFRGNDAHAVIFRRVSMALWPTRPNENQRRPRAGGDPRPVDSRSPAFAEDKLRGNDVIIRRASELRRFFAPLRMTAKGRSRANRDFFTR